jgi:hypothetical protein
MEYVVRQPRTKSLLVPVLALAIGAAGAVGLNAALDDSDGGSGSARVIITDPVTPGSGTAAKDEAAAAAAIARHPATVGATGVTVNPSTGYPVGETKDEASSAAAIGNSSSSPLVSRETKDEAATAAAVGYPTLNSAEAEAKARQQESTGAPVGIPSPAAAAKMNGGTGSGTAAKDEANTAAAIGSGANSTP